MSKAKKQTKPKHKKEKSVEDIAEELSLSLIKESLQDLAPVFNK